MAGWDNLAADVERIYISMKTADLEALDEKVRWLKANGWPAMNRSRLLRIAIGALDVECMIGPLLDTQPLIDAKIVDQIVEAEAPRGRKSRDKRPDRARREVPVGVWHCGYCGEAGHNIRTCPHIENGVDNIDPPIIAVTSEDTFG